MRPSSHSCSNRRCLNVVQDGYGQLKIVHSNQRSSICLRFSYVLLLVLSPAMMPCSGRRTFAGVLAHALLFIRAAAMTFDLRMTRRGMTFAGACISSASPERDVCGSNPLDPLLQWIASSFRPRSWSPPSFLPTSSDARGSKHRRCR